MVEADVEKIKEAMVELDETEVERLVRNTLTAEIEPLRILDALRSGLEVVGEKFEASEYFISELIIAGQVMRRALDILVPHLKTGEAEAAVKVVLGSALGDMHDIGKDIVKTLLVSSGFEVYDLGIDVSPQKFVDKVKEIEASVLAISALLSTTVQEAAKVVEELKKAGLRDKVKVIMGGAAVRESMIKTLGVDAAVDDAIKGISIIKSWTGRK